MTTTSNHLLLNGSQSFVNFKTQIGTIPEGKIPAANKLKELILFCLLSFEKNSVNELFSVSFTTKDGLVHSHSLDTMLRPFRKLEVLPGSIVACNFPIYLDDLKEIFERDSSIDICGLICPGTDQQSIDFLQKRNEDIFIRADEILSHKRGDMNVLLGLNSQTIPKFSHMPGTNFAEQTMFAAKMYF